jgi:hypothetical protein
MAVHANHDHARRGPAIVPASLLRFSAMQRLAIAAALALLLWGAVLWAIA